MSSINPARSFVILSAAVLALVLFAPRSAKASDSGYAGTILLGVFAVGVADIVVGIYDLQATPRIGKRAAALQLALTAPQVVLGALAIVVLTGPEGAPILGLAGLAVTVIPLAVAIYSLYVLLTPDPKAQLSARLERGIGIELPAPKVSGIERVMLTPTVISAARQADWVVLEDSIPIPALDRDNLLRVWRWPFASESGTAQLGWKSRPPPNCSYRWPFGYGLHWPRKRRRLPNWWTRR